VAGAVGAGDAAVVADEAAAGGTVAAGEPPDLPQALTAKTARTVTVATSAIEAGRRDIELSRLGGEVRASP
jgi:hypothetical protein